MATDNVKDLDLTEDLDIRINNGDFVVNYSDANHILCIIKTTIGSFKQFPLIGVGIDYYLSSTGQEPVVKRNINVQLESDSYENIEVKVNADNTYFVNAKRKL